MKKLIKNLLRRPSDAIVRSTSVLPERIDWTLEKVLERHLFDATCLAGKFVPVQSDLESHVRLRADPTADVPRDANGLPFPVGMKDAVAHEHRGKEDAASVRRALFGNETPRDRRILEFGCGLGRLIRHFHDLASTNEIWGTDIEERYTWWLQDNLSPPFHFVTTTTTPHLPFEDRYFDYIYSGSVFTHIYDLYDMWLVELRRLLRPGGRLFITIHDESSIALLQAKHGSEVLTRKLHEFDQASGVLGRPYSMFTVSRRPQGAQVFHNREWLVRHLGSFFRVVSVTDAAYGYQSGYLLERPADRV